LTAYTTRRQRTAVINLIVRSLPVMQINEARRQLEHVLGDLEEWTSMDRYFSEFDSPEGSTRSITASTFSAGLELVREGMAELQQNSTFAPLYIRRAKSAAAPGLDPRANGR
jgi:segregation and condensation protein A